MTPDELVLRWRHLPRHVTRRMLKYPAVRKLGLDDAAAAGAVGLVQASRRWDPERGSFYKFACVCVRRAVLDACVHAWAVSIPQRMVPGRCRDLNWDDDVTRVVESVSGVSVRNVQDGATDASSEDIEYVERLLSKLTRRERWLLRCRYWHGMTDAAVGRVMHSPGSTARDLRLRALDKLRQVVREEDW